MAFGVVDILLALALGVAIIYAMSMLKSKKSVESVKKPASMTSSSDSKTSNTGNVEMSIFFGSQSGTAENFAYDLSEEAKNYNFKASVSSLEDVDPTEFCSKKFAVVIVATHGEGEPTDDSADFWDYIKDDNKDPATFENTFCVFALGNRQYRYFAAIGKKIDEVLGKMGGERLLPLGIGDDDQSLEDDWEAWRAQFWSAASLKYHGSVVGSSGSTFQSSYDVSMFPDASEQAKKYDRSLTKVARFFSNPAKDVKVEVCNVVEARELRTEMEGYESTAHLEIDLSNTKIKYRTADNLGIYARNDYKMVGDLAKRLGVLPSSVFSVKSKAKRKAHLPAMCSVEDALLYYLDINNVLRSKYPAILAGYAKSESEKAKLNYYANDTKGKDEFHDLKYNWLEVLNAFPSIEIPFSHFIELAPRAQPRYYTISSSSKVQPKKISITVTRLFGTKPDNREHLGVCSSQTCSMIGNTSTKNKEVIAFVRDSPFRLPVRAGTPIIMIGPGTGIAPFRAFIQEFATRKENKFGDTVLYFGCRNKDKDYIYQDELETAVAEGHLTELHVALSRQPGQDKKYVQDLLLENGEKTWKLIEGGAYIFVCGGTSMGNDVRKVLTTIGHQYGGLTELAAEAYMDKLALQRKYVQELWA